MRISVLGGTGYTGSNIVREAVGRGHEVTSFSRSAPAEPVAGVRYGTGSVQEDSVLERAVEGADVVVSALSPRDGLEDAMRGVLARVAARAGESQVRLVVVGGFSGLRPTEGAPRFTESGDVPEQFAAEAHTMVDVLTDLAASAPELDWLFVSPAATYGAYAPGEARGEYRVGGEVALFDAQGESAISGADFALALVDEIERHEHRRAQITFAY